MKPLLVASLILSAALPAGAGVRLDVGFCLDSTGSMAGEIQEAKARIREIAAELGRGQPPPDVRYGLVTFRDRGDEYVTRSWAMTRSLDELSAALEEIQAGGGGDCPEAVVEALELALEELDWDDDPDTQRLLYLVGDAPHHSEQEEECRLLLGRALHQGVVLHTVLCRDSCGARERFRRLALATEGEPRVLGEPPRRDPSRAPAPPQDLTAVLSASLVQEAGDAGAEYRGRPLPWEILEEGSESGLCGRLEALVRDAATWRALWAIHRSVAEEWPLAPEIDFDRRAVVILAAGRRVQAEPPRVLGVTGGPEGPVVEVDWGEAAQGDVGPARAPYLFLEIPAQAGRLQVVGGES